MMLRFCLTLACTLVLGAVALPAQAPAAGLTTGFVSGELTSGTDAGVYDDVAASGAGIVRIAVTWSAVAPRRPAAPADPADPGYRWSASDAAVAAARIRGLDVLLTIDTPPAWAEQGTRPKRYRPGTYKLDPRAIGDFATAVGRRYASSVHYVQLLNEPNLAIYLAPQWQKGKPFAATRYRALLNAAYPGLHAAGMQLVTAGTAPYGDPGRAGQRTRPRVFWRAVMSRRVHFDILAHHPYAVGGPRQRALSKNDIAVPDVHRLASLVRAGVRAGRVLPAGPKPTWVTEIAWDSRPPDPYGIPMRRFTRWVADSMWVLWRQGVDHVFWYRVRDERPVPSFAATRQSGLYYATGAPKPALAAFRFPLACERRGSATRLWLRAPDTSPVTLTAGGSPVRTLTPSGDRIATAVVPGHRTLQAQSGSLRSNTCRV